MRLIDADTPVAILRLFGDTLLYHIKAGHQVSVIELTTDENELHRGMYLPIMLFCENCHPEIKGFTGQLKDMIKH